MSPLQICVLGGSSPFTVSLVDCLALVAGSLGPGTLTLHGRSAEGLDLMVEYSANRLGPSGWSVEGYQSVADSLAGATIVIHQIRYGDLVGRASGERLAQRLGAVADETLGPAALLTGINAVPELSEICHAIVTHCPFAWVLNLTNPLSAVTYLMQSFGVARCVGLCELPLVTAQAAARRFELDDRLVEWTYSGLNHRGFIDSLTLGSRDLLKELPRTLHDETLIGISAEQISVLNAIPLKYYRLLGEHDVATLGRAQYLSSLRQRIQSELRTSTALRPPSLSERYMDWYPKSVVPMIVALRQRRPTQQVVNVLGENGLVVETLASVSSTAGILPRFHESTNGRVVQWNAVFERHERAFLRAVQEPNLDTIEEALHADPLLQDELVESATQELLAMVSLAGAQ